MFWDKHYRSLVLFNVPRIIIDHGLYPFFGFFMGFLDGKYGYNVGKYGVVYRKYLFSLDGKYGYNVGMSQQLLIYYSNS